MFLPIKLRLVHDHSAGGLSFLRPRRRVSRMFMGMGPGGRGSWMLWRRGESGNSQGARGE